MLKKVLAVLLAVTVLLALAACGKQENLTDPFGTLPFDEQAITINEAVGSVTLRADSEFVIAYDQDGIVVALDSVDQSAAAICAAYSGFTGKSLAHVAWELLELQLEFYHTVSQGYILLKVHPGSTIPRASFLSNVADDLRKNAEGYQVITVTLEDQNSDGFINYDKAMEILKLFLHDQSIVCSETHADGLYAVKSTTVNGEISEFTLDAGNGVLTVLFDEENMEAVDKTEEVEIPESDIFDPVADYEPTPEEQLGEDTTN